MKYSDFVGKSFNLDGIHFYTIDATELRRNSIIKGWENTVIIGHTTIEDIEYLQFSIRYYVKAEDLHNKLLAIDRLSKVFQNKKDKS